MFLKSNQSLPKNGQKERLLFTFCKTQVHKKKFCRNPPFDQKMVFIRKSKDKKKGFERRKRQETKEIEKILIQKKLQLNVFDVVPLMKPQQRRNKRKERQKNKESKESKKRKEGRQEEKNKRETEKDKLKKGEAKKG